MKGNHNQIFDNLNIELDMPDNTVPNSVQDKKEVDSELKVINKQRSSQMKNAKSDSRTSRNR